MISFCVLSLFYFVEIELIIFDMANEFGNLAKIYFFIFSTKKKQYSNFKSNWKIRECFAAIHMCQFSFVVTGVKNVRYFSWQVLKENNVLN